MRIGLTVPIRALRCWPGWQVKFREKLTVVKHNNIIA